MDATGGRVVEARRFVLRDSRDLVRAEIATGADDSPVLSFRDGAGVQRLTAGLQYGGEPSVELGDRNGSTRLALRVEDRESPKARVELLGAGGLRRAVIYSDDASAQLEFYAPDGTLSIFLNVLDIDADRRVGPELSLVGKRGEIRATYDVYGCPHLILYDAARLPRYHASLTRLGQPMIVRHRVSGRRFDSWLGVYVTPPPFRPLWENRLVELERRAEAALLELGDTPDKVSAALTAFGILPTSDDVLWAGTLVARYISWTKRLGRDCEVGRDRLVLWRRMWMLWRLQITVDLPPAVAGFIKRWDEARRTELASRAGAEK